MLLHGLGRCGYAAECQISARQCWVLHAHVKLAHLRSTRRLTVQLSSTTDACTAVPPVSSAHAPAWVRLPSSGIAFNHAYAPWPSCAYDTAWSCTPLVQAPVHILHHVRGLLVQEQGMCHAEPQADQADDPISPRPKLC